MTGAAGPGMNRWLIQPAVPVRGGGAPAGALLEKSRPRPHIDLLVPRKFPEPILNQPSAQASSPITMYTSATCGYCMAAKNFLKSRGLAWKEVRIDLDPAERERMMALARRTSVPQIFIGDTHVGGYDDMMALHRAGKLDPLLAGVAE
jgi:glutaredoxin 3